MRNADRLTKNARKVVSLRTAFQQELDHTDTTMFSGWGDKLVSMILSCVEDLR
jgi:hypothetical protein